MNWKKMGRGLARPVGEALARAGIPADAVTAAGLLLAGACGVALSRGAYLPAFGLLLLSSLCDLFDGAVARARGGTGTPMGAAMDSTFDRYGEGLVLTGVLIDGVVRREAGATFIWLWAVALIASFLISYVRARAEGLGLKCEVGLLERPHRLALLGLLCLLGPRSAVWILAILAVAGHVTVAQRLAHVHAATARKAREAGRAPEQDRV